jgi:hypothetical protein
MAAHINIKERPGCGSKTPPMNPLDLATQTPFASTPTNPIHPITTSPTSLFSRNSSSSLRPQLTSQTGHSECSLQSSIRGQTAPFIRIPSNSDWPGPSGPALHVRGEHSHRKSPLLQPQQWQKYAFSGCEPGHIEAVCLCVRMCESLFSSSRRQWGLFELLDDLTNTLLSPPRSYLL